jgi:hypothetical protein
MVRFCDREGGVTCMFTWEWGERYLAASLAQSIWLTAILAALYLGFRLLGPRFEGARSFTREFAVVLALRALWQYVGRRVRTHSAGAQNRAEQVQRLQNWLHLPNELTIQHAVLGHPLLIQVMNLYYATAHLDGMGLFLVWVWWRRRSSFRPIRNTVVATTLICLLIQMIPVAPPRLLIHGGFVDTGLQFGQSVYGPYQTGLAAQLTAMPSLHIGWAFILAWYIARLGRGPLRWVGGVHLVVTFFVIVATANHWWLDGVAAIAVVLVVLAAQSLLRRGLAAWREGHRSDPVPAVQQPRAGVTRGAPVGRESKETLSLCPTYNRRYG